MIMKTISIEKDLRYIKDIKTICDCRQVKREKKKRSVLVQAYEKRTLEIVVLE